MGVTVSLMTKIYGKYGLPCGAPCWQHHRSTHRRKPGRQSTYRCCEEEGLSLLLRSTYRKCKEEWSSAVTLPPKNTETSKMYSLRLWGRGSACNPSPSEVHATVADEATGLGRAYLPPPAGMMKRSAKNNIPAVDSTLNVRTFETLRWLGVCPRERSLHLTIKLKRNGHQETNLGLHGHVVKFQKLNNAL